MFNTEEKQSFASQNAPVDSAADNEAADWSIAQSLADGVTVNTGEPVPAEQLSEVDFTMADVLASAIQLTADIAAPNWKITEDESQSLATAWGNVIEVWLPGATLNPKWMALGLAAATTAVIAKSRAGVPLRQPKIEKREEKEVKASD
jgi:hypothetical protein